MGFFPDLAIPAKGANTMDKKSTIAQNEKKRKKTGVLCHQIILIPQVIEETSLFQLRGHNNSDSPGKWMTAIVNCYFFHQMYNDFASRSNDTSHARRGQAHLKRRK